MSKIYRGRKASEGGDRQGEWIADDGTPDTAIDRIKRFYLIYKEIQRLYPDRVISVRTEDLILKPEQEVGRVADFFKVVPTQQALEFYKYNRNKYHGKRYQGHIDTSQVDMYKRWDTIYDGFFSQRGTDIEQAKRELRFIIKGLGYEI